MRNPSIPVRSRGAPPACSRPAFALAAFVLATVGSGVATGGGAAFAACGGTAAVDRCLVGGWATDGGGVAEWLRRNMPPGFPMPQMDTGGAVVFDPDGSYRAIPSDPVLGGGSAGRWSAADGRLQMCELERIGRPPAGMVPIPEPTGEPMAMAYRCEADSAETRLRIPMFDDPLVMGYTRVDPATVRAGAGR